MIAVRLARREGVQDAPLRTGILLHFGWLGRTSYELLYSERSADTTSEVEAALSTLSSQGIVLAGAAAVREYLFKHPDMVDLLLSVCAAALERFGPHTQLCLDVYSDPEIEDRYLTLYVRQQSYGPDIQDRIESLAADYEEDLAGKTGWLLLTTDFRSPR